MSNRILTRVRKICLALPGACEDEKWGQPHFCVDGKIFAGCGDENGNDTGKYTFAFATGKKVTGFLEVPHKAKAGQTNAQFHVHFMINDAPAGATDNVRWQLTYFKVTTGDTIPTPTVITVEDTVDTQYETYTFGFPVIAVEPMDQIGFVLERIAATSDDFADECYLLTTGLHYEIDTMGSRLITTK